MGTYKKTYLPMILWSVIFVFGETAFVDMGEALIKECYLEKLSLSITMFALLFLFLMIYLGQYVYWISGGPDYATALAAGPARRKAYAWRHLFRFLLAAGVWLVYVIPSMILKLPDIADLIVFCVLVMGAALSSMKIRF